MGPRKPQRTKKLKEPENKIAKGAKPPNAVANQKSFLGKHVEEHGNECMQSAKAIRELTSRAALVLSAATNICDHKPYKQDDANKHVLGKAIGLKGDYKLEMEKPQHGEIKDMLLRVVNALDPESTDGEKESAYVRNALHTNDMGYLTPIEKVHEQIAAFCKENKAAVTTA